MKRGALLLVILLFVFPIISAEINDSNPLLNDEQSKINAAYNCLKDKVEECSTSLEDNIFTLLAIKECENEVRVTASDSNCWPDTGCQIKTTAQATLALSKAGGSTTDEEDWLFLQNKTPQDIEWYLEIESPEQTSCKIIYDDLSHIVVIGEDKKISSNAGTCLSLSEGAYWLRISPDCYSKEFEISCDEGFLTTLLFKKKLSSTIQVSEKTSSMSAEGTTKEKVNSFCFASGNSCDYEGSLWAVLVLDYLGHDMSAFIPYLVTMADENSEYLPESFLYLLTGNMEYRTDLFTRQISGGWWDESDDKFYDTAIALFPFPNENPPEKQTAKDWLLNIQGDDGCWDSGRIKSNAFVLYSLWPKDISSTPGEKDCDDMGYYCMSEISCEGNILSYDCPSGTNRCCDTPKTVGTCSAEGGVVCDSDKTCSISTIEASDTFECCTGYCQAQGTTQTTCELNEGTCRYTCNDNEEPSDSYTCDSSEACCFEKGGIFWWIWLLLILIILVVVAIVFRDRIRPYWIKFQSKLKKTKPGTPGPMYPMISPRAPMRSPMQRRILPPSSRPQPQRPSPTRKPSSEIDDVLKKLRDIGK